MAKKISLILHPGYFRCASTYLQNSFFKKNKKILNIGKPFSKKDKVSYLFNILFKSREEFRSINEEDQIVNLSNLICKKIINSKKKIVVISDEIITDDIFYNLDQNITILEKLLNKIKEQKRFKIELKILIIKRNQFDLLYSLYSYNEVINSTYKNFEQFVKYFLKYKFSLLHYKFVEKKFLTLKPKEIKILNYEVLKKNPKIFFQNLTTFVLNKKVSNFDLKYINKSLKKDNLNYLRKIKKKYFYILIVKTFNLMFRLNIVKISHKLEKIYHYFLQKSYVTVYSKNLLNINKRTKYLVNKAYKNK